MNLENLKNQLKIDEGCRFEVYLDSEGLPTFGIGHLLTKNDVEYFAWKQTKKLTVCEKRVYEVFEKDVKIACDSCKKLLPEFDYLPSEVKEILANMMFNLGPARLAGFSNFLKAIRAKDWKQAAKEMIDSKWYRQVGNRAKRLVARMESINVNPT